MKIALSADHTGFELLPKIAEYLESSGHEVLNDGPKVANPEDDYPDLIRPAAEAVSSGQADALIIVGGSGQGEAMAANRFKGVRCAVFYSPAAAKQAVDAEGDVELDPYEIVVLSRRHNLANGLSLASRFLTPEEMFKAIEVWLSTPLGDSERHVRRAAKLDQI